MAPRNPLVSVVIPTFNSAAFLPATLESVLCQSTPDFEIIVVDDGSTDDTASVVARYGDRLRYVRQANSGGPARPRNVGIAVARGRYISIFDSDDLMAPDKLQRSADFAESCPGLGLIFTDFTSFGDQGELDGTHLDKYSNFAKVAREHVAPGRYRIKGPDAHRALFFGNYIGTSSVLVPKRVFEEVGPFDESVTRGGLDDRDMWFKIAAKYDIGLFDFVGHRYRVRAGSVSTRTLEAAAARITVIQRHLSPLAGRSLIRQADTVIAESLTAMGYAQWSRRQLKPARALFIKSLRVRPSWLALLGVLSTLTGRTLQRGRAR